MLRASPMDRGGLHTWLATRKAESDKKREEEVGLILFTAKNGNLGGAGKNMGRNRTDSGLNPIIICILTGGHCKQPMVGKKLSAREEERSDAELNKQAAKPCLRGEGELQR